MQDSGQSTNSGFSRLRPCIGLALLLALVTPATACKSQPEVVRASGGEGGTSPFDASGGTGGTSVSATAGASGQAGGGGSEPLPMPETPQLDLPQVDLPGASATTDFEFIPGKPDELIVISHPGEVLHYRLTSNAVRLLGRTNIPQTHHRDGCGLLSLVLDPEFEQNGFLYIARCVTLTSISIARYTLENLAELSESEVDILTIEQETENFEWHRFGSMGFEPDAETLWVFLGDFTESRLAQDPQAKPGSLLRIKPNREPNGSGYEPATGNAFSPEEGDPSIYAFGLRSPWRGYRDRFGRFWFGDVGDNTAEEVNLISEPGQNLGWDTAEGRCSGDCEGITDPLVTYGRASDEPYVIEDPQTEPNIRRAIWVGQPYFHEQDRYFGLFDDAIVFGDYFTGWVRRLEVDQAGNVVSDRSVGHLSQVTAWKTGPDGYMYVLTYRGDLHRAEQVLDQRD